MPVRKQGGESNRFVDQETPVTIGFTHRPARKNAEAHRALELLEDYHAKLTRPQDKQLRLAIERVIRIFKSRLFQALLDQRTNNWLLINSTYQIPFLLIIYIYFVLRCGPQYMKNRPPYSLKTFIKFYNVFQIIANAWLVYEHIAAGWFTEIPLTCVPVDYSYKPGPYRLATIMWWVLLLKLVDLIETGIYVLRKKYNQISFLHVYHHVSNCVFSWIYTKYVPGGMTTFITLLNCSVHVIMYTYYLLATFGPTIQKVINPIKPSITILQMVQFIVLIIYVSQALFPNCPVPGVFGPVFIGNLIINLFLFYRFYKNRYIKSKNM